MKSHKYYIITKVLCTFFFSKSIEMVSFLGSHCSSASILVGVETRVCTVYIELSKI